MVVGRGSGPGRGPAGPALRGPLGPAPRPAAGRGGRPPARPGVHRQRRQVPPARQPRPPARGDRRLPALPRPAGRADRARGSSSPSATSPPGSCSTPARASPGCGAGRYPFGAGRAPCWCPPIHPAAALRGGGEVVAQMRADFVRARAGPGRAPSIRRPPHPAARAMTAPGGRCAGPAATQAVAAAVAKPCCRATCAARRRPRRRQDHLHPGPGPGHGGGRAGDQPDVHPGAQLPDRVGVELLHADVYRLDELPRSSTSACPRCSRTAPWRSSSGGNERRRPRPRASRRPLDPHRRRWRAAASRSTPVGALAGRPAGPTWLPPSTGSPVGADDRPARHRHRHLPGRAWPSAARTGPSASLQVRQGRRHAELLAPAIETLTRMAGIGIATVGRVAVDIGPGLFTGLRVGVATAKALAAALDIPIVGCSSLDAARLPPPPRRAGWSRPSSTPGGARSSGPSTARAGGVTPVTDATGELPRRRWSPPSRPTAVEACAGRRRRGPALRRRPGAGRRRRAGRPRGRPSQSPRCWSSWPPPARPVPARRDHARATCAAPTSASAGQQRADRGRPPGHG